MMIAASHAIATLEGCIVGSLFRRGDATPLTEATLGASSGTVSAASELTRDHWGDYVAFGTSRAVRYALRAPFGSLPCYWHEAPDHVVMASSVRLLCTFGGLAPAVDWHALGHFLAATDLRNGRTCLRGVEELGGGQAIEASDRGIRLERHWSPWPWTDRAQAFHNRDAAAEALAGAIDIAVVSLLPVDVPAILLLSGGLDSSVVAAALASSGRRFTCLTMVVADAQGDERDHALAMARHLDVPLVEVVRDPRQVDLTRPLALGLPRPTGAQFRQATFAAADDLARETGSTLVIDGGGGDNMFCSLQSVAPVVDALLGIGRESRPLATAASIARMAQVSIAAVLARAGVRLVTRRAAYRWPVDHSFLDPGIVDGLDPSHPWLEVPRGTPPGKAAQVGLLLAAMAVAYGLDPDRHPALLSPLVSQPIAEAALGVPSWMWFEEGRNRVPVRQAYAARLPASVVGRRSKGTPTGFLARLVERETDMLRPFLLDGCLAIQGVIDRAAVEAALAPGPARDLRFARLLQLAGAEAWARSWG
ncbi:asparagine synthase (glutamine-hydrolyzing) [Sphingomonas sp. SORGH_AS802]|uniref:asparagine synthase-related protein n=1 Tax=unclassified Sphingomonas TaxID=196159 RepID=UPI0028665AED|nr:MULTISPECIES: asparagine synthase-related protein [unclassified Sphingomonas]MDR6128761.1 asparagine synthase (glutamine-hydrolyzing) [Sphingomonas sp. SORGH_AS_0438]MDR6136225.1 asparagine synthase (glutamine-hydrolyzing) [Sphingomonas sp. SORGH_AS_0802]